MSGVTLTIRAAVALLAIGGCRPVVTEQGVGPAVSPTGVAGSPRIRTYREGDLMKLERVDGKDSLIVATRESWGNAIVELSLNGVNVVNAYDPGRNIQPSLYDGRGSYDNCSGCTGLWGWNPVLAGDDRGHGSPVIGSSVAADVLYTRTTPLEWVPANKGGGDVRPVLSDVVIEQWISVVPSSPRAVHVRFRIEHLGADDHGSADQELPAIWVNGPYARLMTSGPGRAWTGLPVVVRPVQQATPSSGSPPVQYTTDERWAALVDSTGFGLAVYVPWAFPFVKAGHLAPVAGRRGWEANYLKFVAPSALSHGQVLEGDYYLLIGDLNGSRTAIATIAREEPRTPDPLAPMGAWDGPQEGSDLHGEVPVVGWALDNVAIGRIDVLVDGARLGEARYGIERPDVGRAFPGVGTAVGFSFLLDTKRLTPGSHVLSVETRDQVGNIRTYGGRRIVVRR